MLITICAAIIILQCSLLEAKIELPAEWHMWKSSHGKEYASESEEIERHIVWQSNKRYIQTHNLFNDTFGFTLEMNEFGDLVSCRQCATILHR